jgi:hypothetical protein
MGVRQDVRTSHIFTRLSKDDVANRCGEWCANRVMLMCWLWMPSKWFSTSPVGTSYRQTLLEYLQEPRSTHTRAS